jgi:hypothetical protein
MEEEKKVISQLPLSINMVQYWSKLRTRYSRVDVACHKYFRQNYEAVGLGVINLIKEIN